MVAEGYGLRPVLFLSAACKHSEDKMLQPVEAEPAEMVVDSRPRREVRREQAPRAAAPQSVEDGVEDVAQAMGARPTW